MLPSTVQRNRLFLILVLILFAFLAYTPMLKAPFKTLDDNISIINNSDIKDFSNIGTIFQSSFFGDKHYYRPLVSISYMLEYHFFGLNPFFYNLDNLILHILISIGILFLLGLLGFNEGQAFAAAFLFVIHPVNWEPICNISGRAIILSTLFVVWGFYCYIRGKTNPIYAVMAGIFLILGLLSKESAVMFPVLLCVYEWAFNKKEEPKGKVLQKLGVYFLIIFIFVLWRKFLGFTEVYTWRNIHELSLGFITFLNAQLTYLRLFIFPLDVHFDRSKILFGSFIQWETIATVLIYLVLCIVLWRLRRYFSKRAIFFLLWYAVELFPVSQIIASIGVGPGVISIAEHFLYTASIGMFAFLVLMLTMLYERKIIAPALAKAAGVCGIILFMSISLRQSVYASSTEMMLRQSLYYNPHNARILLSLGLELAKEQRYKEAEDNFRLSLAHEPLNVMARISLGKALCDQNRYVEGITEYERVINPGRFEDILKDNLNLSYAILVKKYEERIANDPDNAQAYYSLGIIYAKQKDLSGAEKAFYKAVGLSPGYSQALFNLASILEAQGRKEEALRYYAEFLGTNSSDQVLNDIARERLNRP